MTNPRFSSLREAPRLSQSPLGYQYNWLTSRTGQSLAGYVVKPLRCCIRCRGQFRHQWQSQSLFFGRSDWVRISRR